MITVEQVIYVLPILALTASILYYTLNLRTANKNQKMQLETRQAQLFINVYNQTLNNQPNRDAHKLMSTWRWSNIDELWATLLESDKAEQNMDALLLIDAFYNGVSILIKEKLLHIRYVETMSFWIIAFWDLFCPYIDEVRAKTYPKLFIEIEYLYNEFMKYYEKNPDQAL